MLNNLFGKGKETAKQQAAAPAPVAPVATPHQYKPTKKKKNTYIVRFETFTAAGMHKLCASTPLAVIKLNGEPTKNENSGWMVATPFPNPGACQMEVLFHRAPEWRIIVGDKMTKTIIEYMDKESGKPALMLYPTGHVSSLIPNMDANTVVGTRLNHASRRDFIHQYNRIIEHVQIVNPLIKVRNQAMQHAPAERNYEAYTKFIAELDKQQIERAKQIVAQRQK